MMIWMHQMVAHMRWLLSKLSGYAHLSTCRGAENARLG
jgi:hypothetical protein